MIRALQEALAACGQLSNLSRVTQNAGHPNGYPAFCISFTRKTPCNRLYPHGVSERGFNTVKVRKNQTHAYDATTQRNDIIV